MIIALSDHSAHANLMSIHGIGVLIMGPSGAGKTDLSHQLIQKDPAYQLICDDLVLLCLKKDFLTQYTYLHGQAPYLDFAPPLKLSDREGCTSSQPIHLLAYLGSQANFLDLAKSDPLLSHIPYQINLKSKNKTQDLHSFIQDYLFLKISLYSFGYKHQKPELMKELEFELEFDLRAWPNPYWDEHLRDLNGTDLKIIDFFNQPKNINHCTEQLDLIEKDIVNFVNKCSN